MIDSRYTNPEAIRALYLNPRNALQNVEDITGLPAAVQIAIQAPVVGLTGGGGYYSPGGGGPGYGGGCPAAGQWTMARVPNTLRSWAYKKVEDLEEDADFLYNELDLDKPFRRVVRAEIIRNVECFAYRTFAGAETVCSPSHLPLAGRDDRSGRPLVQLIEEADLSHRSVSRIDGEIADTEIRYIVTAGRHDIVHITLEGIGGGIYWCGTDPDKLNACHNKPNNGDGGFDSPFGGVET